MRIYVERPNANPKKLHFFKGEWLKSETDRENMATEAQAWLSDPRDLIVRVKIFDDRFGQFEPVTYASDWVPDGTRKITKWQDAQAVASTSAPSKTRPTSTTAPAVATVPIVVRGAGRISPSATAPTPKKTRRKVSNGKKRPSETAGQ